MAAQEKKQGGDVEMAQSEPTATYAQTVTVPKADASSVDAHRKALDRAQVNLETQQNRRLNLELEKEFGAKVWQENLLQ